MNKKNFYAGLVFLVLLCAVYVVADFSLKSQSGNLLLNPASGTVGIGTTNPCTVNAGGTSLSGKCVHIYNTSNTVRLVVEGTQAGLYMSDYNGASNDKALNFYVDGGVGVFRSENDDGSARQSSILSMDLGDGTVGIGTSTPGGRLHVTWSSYPPILAERTSSQTSVPLSSMELLHKTTSDMSDGFGPVVSFSIQDSAGVDNGIAWVGALRDGADNSGKLAFSTTNAGSATQKMVVDKNGNVGVGVTTPLQKLHVSGNLNVTGDIYYDGALVPYSPLVVESAEGDTSVICMKADDGNFVGVYVKKQENAYVLAIDATACQSKINRINSRRECEKKQDYQWNRESNECVVTPKTNESEIL